MKKFLSLIFTVIIFAVSNAQIAHQGHPLSWEEDIAKPVNFMAESLSFSQKSATTFNKGAEAFKFAEAMVVNKGTKNFGTWNTLDNGSKVWRMQLSSEGAYSINFTFSTFNIPPGAKVFVYDAGGDQLLGAFTHENVKKSGILPVAPLSGSTVIIEYNEPANAEFSGELFVSQLGHDFVGVFGNDAQVKGESGDCNVDVNCGEAMDWQIEKNAICRIIINNQDLCTGTLLNNHNQDGKPYILSANHCADDQSKADEMVFLFNYENAFCGGGTASEMQSISGANLVATKNNNGLDGHLDFALFELSSLIPDAYEPYFAGWDARGNVPQMATGLHHPEGDVMKISKDFDPLTIDSYTGFGFDLNSFWKVAQWDLGVTEGGSSGSAIFDENHRVVGSLTGGSAYCGYPLDDFYQMFSLSYDTYDTDSTQLKTYLDPNNTGVKFLDGYDPYNRPVNTSVEAISHWDVNEDMAIFTTDGGYVSGNNEWGDLTKAEYFSLNDFGGREVILGGYAFFSKATGNPSQDIEFFIYSESGGQPNEKIASTALPMSLIIAETENVKPVYFKFDNPVAIPNGVFVGVTLPQAAGDTLALFNTDVAPDVNYAWEQDASTSWFSYTDTWGGNWINYFALQAANLTDEEMLIVPGLDVMLYPNPANDYLVLEGIPENKKVQLNVYDLYGKLVYKQDHYMNAARINCGSWNNGLYIISLMWDGKHSVKKLLISH